MEGGAVPAAGLGVAPVPDATEHGPSTLGESSVAGDAPEVLLVALARLAGSPDHAVA